MEDYRELSRAFVDEDRISNFPFPLICHILSFLRTKTVVATNNLSKKWRCMWTEVTTLNFHLRGEKPDLWDSDEEEMRKFVEFVNRVSLHINPQPLQKFKLKWWGPPETSYVLIWTSIAISRCVRELVIKADLPEGTQLPATLFTCATLQVLKLRVDFVLKLPTVMCLPKLEALELHFLFYESSECFTKLISCCPALRRQVIGRTSSKMLDYRVSSLSLRRLEIFNSEERMSVGGGELVVMLYDSIIEIHAPNLEHFVMSEAVRECSVKGITLVDRAEIDLNVFLDADSDDDGVINGLYTGICNSALKLVEAMNRAKFLDLTNTVIKALSYATTLFSAKFLDLTNTVIKSRLGREGIRVANHVLGAGFKAGTRHQVSHKRAPPRMNDFDQGNEKKAKKDDKCNFCKMSGHFQKDRAKRKEWFKNKGIPYKPNHKVK